MKTTNQKWERIQLVPSIRDDGSVSEQYYFGSDGEEHFRYEDWTGYVIREASKMDTEEWFIELENSQHTYDKIPAYFEALAKAEFTTNAEKGLGCGKKNRVMLIYNPAQELIGIMKLTEKSGTIAEIELAIKRQWMIDDTKQTKVMAVIKRMWKSTLLYDRMYIYNEKRTKKLFLDSDEIAS